MFSLLELEVPLTVIVGTIRKVTKPLKIGTGDVLPVGTITGIDTHFIHFNRSPLGNPEVFDGFRYLELRNKPGNEAKYQVHLEALSGSAESLT